MCRSARSGPQWYLMSWRRKLRCSRSLKLCLGPKFSCSETQREIICSRDRLGVCQLKQCLQAGREVSRQAGQASSPGLLAAAPATSSELPHGRRVRLHGQGLLCIAFSWELLSFRSKPDSGYSVSSIFSKAFFSFF